MLVEPPQTCPIQYSPHPRATGGGGGGISFRKKLVPGTGPEFRFPCGQSSATAGHGAIPMGIARDGDGPGDKQGCISREGASEAAQKRLDGRLEEVAKAVGAVTVGYKCH